MLNPFRTRPQHPPREELHPPAKCPACKQRLYIEHTARGPQWRCRCPRAEGRAA